MGPMASIVTALAVLAALAAAAASSPFNHDSVIEVDLGDSIQKLLPDDLLISLLDARAAEGEGYTKLENALVMVVEKFRDGLASPQPALGLPVMDPFAFTDGKDISINNKFASMNASLESVHSTGLSKFDVDKLSLYLVERTGVLDLTLPNLTFSTVLSVPKGSWVSPLKVPLHEVVDIKFASPKITLGMRGVVSVKNGRLAMESTKINLDLGDWDFQIVSLASGTCIENEGLCAMLAALIRTMAPNLIDDWMPVIEKFINDKLDEKLRDVQLSDLIPPGILG